MSDLNYANKFLNNGFTIDDICKEVIGELLEHENEFASYCYGNGELIAYPVDSEESEVFVVDTYGDKRVLVAW